MNVVNIAKPSTVTGQEFIQRAKDLQPILRKRALETERLGKVHPDTIADFTEAGFFRMFQSS